MGHVETEKNLKMSEEMLTVNTPGFEEEEKKQQVLKKPVLEKKTSKQEKGESYYDRILKNSRDKNTALKVLSMDQAEKGGWDVRSTKRKPSFRQKLAAARDSLKDRREENRAKSVAKGTFADADLCTVREKASMEKYFSTWENGDPGIQGEDVPGDPSLSEYVNEVLNMELSNAVFTDDYLSDHMPQMWEYARKLGHFDYVKSKYPNFYGSLDDETKALLESRALMKTQLGEILTQHMNIHGIRLDRDTNGFHVRLRRVDEEKKDARTLKADYQRNLGKFLSDRVYEDEVGLARGYLKLESFKSDKARAELEKHLASHTRAKDICGEEIKAAADEMENAWRVRDGLLVEQEVLLKNFDEARSEIQKAEFRTMIVRNNHRIRLASRHADNYKNFIDFVTGEVQTIKKGTAKFLEAENQQDMLDIVHFKAMGDFLEEAMVGDDIMNARKEIEKLRKDVVERPSDDPDGFDVIELKQESADKIHQIEEDIKKMTYVRMPLDMFYSKLADFKKLKAKSRRYHELWDGSLDRLRGAKQAAAQRAKRAGIRQIDGDDRYINIFREIPFGEEKRSPQTGLTDYELLAVFSGYKESRDVDPEIREEVRGRGKALLNEIMSITPEKMLEYRCPDDPDIEKPEFWHKRSMVYALHDYMVTFDSFKQWNIPLTEEQYAHIRGLSTMAQGMVRGYAAFEDKMNDPVSIAVNDKRLTGKKLDSMSDNIFYPYYDGEGNVPADKEVHERLSRFAKGGALAMNIRMAGRRKDTNVLEATSYYAYNKYLSDDMVKGKDEIEEYKGEKSKHLKAEDNSASADEFAKEKELMQEYFPDAQDAEVRTRLLMKETKRLTETALSDSQKKAWAKHFGDASQGAGDLRSFSYLLRPVKYDLQGVPTEESRDAFFKNQRDIEDYMSGNVKRRNRVLRRIGKEIAAIKITDEMLTYDYLKKNHEKLYPVIILVHNFQNIWKEYPDFFESDVFTQEERDSIRQNVTGSNTLTALASVYGQFCNTFSGETQQRKQKGQTKEEKLSWGRSCADTYTNMSRMMLESDDKEGVAGAEKIRKRRVALYADEKKADEIRRASVLWAKAKAELEKVERDRRTLSGRIKDLPEGGSKKKLMAEKADEAGYEEKVKRLKAKVALADEVRSYVYGEKQDLSPDARQLYENEMKESVIHAEYEISRSDREEKSKQEEAKAKDLAGDAMAKALAELEEEGGEDSEEVKAKNLAGDALSQALNELEAEEEEKTEELKEEKKEEIKEEQKKQEEQENAGQQAVAQGPVYHAEATLAAGTVYEPQGYLNCWACSGAALFNKFVELTDGQLTQPVNQYDIRGFKPGPGDLKTLEEVNAHAGIQVDNDWYNDNLKELYKFMGENAKNNGSIFEVADFFMKKRKDFVLNQMEFRLGGGMEQKDIEAYEAQKAVFTKQINDILQTGNLVALYEPAGNHYVTITKIDGDNLTYLDSLVGEGQPASEVTEPVESLFSRDNAGSNLSITWFSKLKSPEEMKQDYPDLQYDEHAGYSYTREEELRAGALNLAQTKGICITKSKSDPVLGLDAVKHHIYIPKLGDEPVQMQQAGGEQQMRQEQQLHQMEQEQEKKEQEQQKQQEEEKKEERSGEQKKAMIVRREKQGGEKAPVWDVKADKAKIRENMLALDSVLYQRSEMIEERSTARPEEWRKNHIGKDTSGGRKARALTSILTYFKNDSEDEAWATYSGITVTNLKTASPEQKQNKSRALERVFELLIDFDMNQLTLNDRNDMLSEDYFDVRLVCYAVHEIPEEYFQEYETLMKDGNANCALNEKQLKEIRCKWSTIYECAAYFMTYPELAGNENLTEDEINGLMNMSAIDLVDQADKTNDPEMGKLYNQIALLNQSRLTGGFVPGEDVVARYKANRTKAELGEDNLCASALEAIKQRAANEGAWAKDATDRHMSAQEQEAVRKQEEKRLREKQARWKKQEEESKRKRIDAGVTLGEELYNQANKSAVKKGKFSKEFLSAADKFMRTVDMWAHSGNEGENPMLEGMGIRDTVDMLYVSGVPIKDFVADRYDYKGDDVNVLRAYAAMIAGRQKYPIVIARPILNDNNETDVMVEALNINSSSLGAKKSKTGSEAYRKALNDAKKKVKYIKEPELKYRGEKVMGELNKAMGSEKLAGLETLMERLLAMNEGTSPAFYHSVNNVGRYLNALRRIYANKESREVGKKVINSLSFYITETHNSSAAYSREMDEKYPKRGQKKSKADTGRIAALDEAIKIMDAHYSSIRQKSEALGLLASDITADIDKLLQP